MFVWKARGLLSLLLFWCGEELRGGKGGGPPGMRVSISTRDTWRGRETTRTHIQTAGKTTKVTSQAGEKRYVAFRWPWINVRLRGHLFSVLMKFECAEGVRVLWEKKWHISFLSKFGGSGRGGFLDLILRVYVTWMLLTRFCSCAVLLDRRFTGRSLKETKPNTNRGARRLQIQITIFHPSFPHPGHIETTRTHPPLQFQHQKWSDQFTWPCSRK